MTKEVKIIIKADGSYAIEELRKTSAAVSDLGKSGKQIEPLDKGLDKISEAASNLSQNTDKAVAAIEELEQELADTTKTTNNAEKGIEQLNYGLAEVVKATSSLEQALRENSTQFKKTSKDTDDAAKKTNALDKILGRFGQSLKTAGGHIKSFKSELGEFTFAANQTLEFLEKMDRYVQMGYDFAKQGAQLQESKSAFDDYARSVGKSADEILNKLRDASGNTINDMSLIKTASAAMSLGVTNDADKMANLLEIARNKARLKGIETQQAFEDIVTGIGRASPQILDDLSIRIPAAFAQMTEGMSDAQKVAVLFEMTLKEGNAEFEDMGGMTDSSADSFRRLETSWTNLKTSGGELVTNVFEPINVVLAIGMDKAAGLLKSFDDLFTYILNIGKENPIKNMTEAELLEALSDRKKLYDEYKSGFAKTLGEVDSPANSFRQSSSLGVTEKVGKEMQNAFFEQNMLVAEKKVEQINAELNRRSKAVIETTEKNLKNQADAFAKMMIPGFNPAAIESEEDRKKRIKKAEDARNNYIKQINDQEKKISKIFEDSASAYSVFGVNVTPSSKQDNKSYTMPDGTALKTFGVDVKSISSMKEAYKLLLDMSYAAGGLKQTTSEVYEFSQSFLAIKDGEQVNKVLTEFYGTVKDIPPELKKFNDEMAELASNKDAIEEVLEVFKNFSTFDFSENINKLNPFELTDQRFAASMTASMSNIFSGGLLTTDFTNKFIDVTKETSQKAAKEVENPFADAVASAVSDGFRRADFSGFLTNLGSGISGVVSGILTDTIQSVFSKKNTGALASDNKILGGLFKPVYGKDNKLNYGALGQNLAIGAAFSFLSSPGRLFGGSVVHGEEHINTSASLNDQVTQAKELRDQLYIQAGISETTRRLLDEAEFYYAWVRKTKSGNGITSKKTTTYLLEGSNQAQASIDNIKKLQESVMGEQTRRSYDLWQLNRTDSVKALQLSAADAESAYNATFAKNLSESEIADLRNQQAAIENNIVIARQNAELAGKQAPSNYNRNPWNIGGISMYTNQIATYQQQIDALEAKIQEGQDYKYSEADRTSVLKAYEQAKIDLVAAKEAGRTNLMSPFLSNATLGSLTTSDILSQMLGDKSLSDSSGSIQALLPLLKQAGITDMNIARMYADAGSDPAKLYDAGKAELSNLEKALAVYEQIWKDAEQEALDASKTIEEQNAAFERFQTAQNALLQTKDAILQKEQELAAIEKQKLESQRNAQIETALSAIGELDKRGNKMIILSDNDAIVAIDALLEEFADNPEVTAILQKKRQAEVAKAKWGSMT
jgi:hypothetical protein